MRSKSINSTSGRKSVTGNGFSDIDFQYDVESFTARRCFLPNYGDFSMRLRSFGHITTSGLKYDVYLNTTQPFSYKDAVISGARHHFRRHL